MRGNIYLALMHHPVLDRNSKKVTSALTNLDIHDLSRLAKTYGLAKIFIVTPDVKQQELAEKIMDHWVKGWGASYNSDRKEAMNTVKIVESVEAIKAELNGRSDKALFIATSAKKLPGCVSFSGLGEELSNTDGDAVILLGTAHGLSQEVFDFSDRILEPIDMGRGYNHLSVRSAASIIIDRLLN